MAGYRCVNYYDLCRLCTTSSGLKINIFSAEGKKKNLHQKISECLPVAVDEKDKLPKIVCGQCLQQIESISEFRNVCLNTQAMLEGCLNSTTLQNGGKVYIKDANARITSITTSNIVKDETVSNVSAGSDFLSTIIQAVGIQSNDDIITETRSQTIPQYTVTLDGKTVKPGQIEYKVEELPNIHSEKQAKHNSLAEFLKMKPNIRVTPIPKKKDPPPQQQQTQTISTPITITSPDIPKQKKAKYNLVLASPSQQHKTATIIPAQTSSGQQTKTVSLQDFKFLSPNKCFLPITIKDSNTDQQIVAQIDTKNLVLPTTYHLQMKLQPQIATVDGQQIVQLTPTAIPATISLTPQSMQTQSFQQSHQHQQHHQDHQTHIITSGIDASTSTNDSEIFTINQLQNQQVPTSITIQQVQQPTTHQQTTSMPKLQLTSIPTTISTTSNQVQIHKSHHQQQQQTAQNNTITVQRINQPHNVKIKVEPVNRVAQTKQTVVAQKNKVTVSTIPSTNNQQQSSNTTTAMIKTENSPAVTNECAICGRAFKKKEHLAQHMKLHAGLRPFKCTETGCNKAFSRKEHLMRHIISHTGKKMFSCDLCQKLFSRKDNLNKHKRTHTEQSGNNGQFVCEICNKSFVVKMYYIQHKMMHEKNGQTTATTTGTTKMKTKKIIQQQQQQQEQQQQQQEQQHSQIMQLQISSPNTNIVTSSDVLTNSVCNVSQGNDQTTTTVLKTLGSHDTAVLNLPSNLANLVSINSAQFMTAGELMGHIKIENK